MKRIVLTLLIVLITSGWLFANHWTPNSGSYEDNMTFTGIVQINGVEQLSISLEVGAFCGEECRGSGMTTYFAPTQHYVVMMLIYGSNGDQLTFKLYDHNLNQEIDMASPDAITFTANGYGNMVDPYILNFTADYDITATANPVEGGTVAGAGAYNQGTMATLTATPNMGYTFINWTKNGMEVSTNAVYRFTVNEPSSFVANFSSNHWIPDITSYEDNMTLTGIIQINGVEQRSKSLEVGVFCGEECRGSGRPMYLASTNRYFVQILVYGENDDRLTFKLYDHELNQELDLASPEAITFVANGYGSIVSPYVLNFTTVFDIMVTADPADGGTVTGAGIYNKGATATISTTPNMGYTFINWTKNGEVISNEAIYSFIVNESGEYVANFSVNHWLPNITSYEDNMTLTGIVRIDGVEQQTTSLEVGVFCGDECRGSGGLVYCAPIQRYIVQLLIYGTDEDQFTFMLYDHELDQELYMYSSGIVAFSPDGYGSLTSPYVLDFLIKDSYEVTVKAEPADGGIIAFGGRKNREDRLVYDFDDGTTQGWTILQGPNSTSPHNWMHSSEYTDDDLTDLGHNNTSGFMFSESYVGYDGVYPDNYLVSPQIQLGGSINFWVTDFDDLYGAEHFALAVSTDGNTDVDDFATVQEWTLHSKSERTGNTRNVYNGTWYEYTVDLSNYYGKGYVAIHHFDCFEQWMICVDDITIEEGENSISGIFYEEELCTVTATANEGYFFVNWTKNGEVVSTDTEYSFVVTEGVTLIANFTPSVTQQINLTQGSNWVSFNVDITLADLKAALVSALGNNASIAIKAKTKNTKYNNGRWVGQLNALDTSQMYIITVGADCNITLVGSRVNPAELSVPITSGSNWIAFPFDESRTVTEAFGSFPVDGDQVKSKTGNTKYNRGRWVGQLTTLQPGQGFIYVSASGDERILTFPTSK